MKHLSILLMCITLLFTAVMCPKKAQDEGHGHEGHDTAPAVEVQDSEKSNDEQKTDKTDSDNAE